MEGFITGSANNHRTLSAVDAGMMRKFLLGFGVGILSFPIVGFAAAWFGWIPTNAPTTPSALEKTFAHLTLHAAARPAQHLSNPIAPTRENLMAGLKIFNDDCAGCHGTPNNATSREPGPILYPNPPMFALKRPSKQDYQLFRIINGGYAIPGCSDWTGNSARVQIEWIFRMRNSGRH
jgi:mono/diheme cytochrome c family protein